MMARRPRRQRKVGTHMKDRPMQGRDRGPSVSPPPKKARWRYRHRFRDRGPSDSSSTESSNSDSDEDMPRARKTPWPLQRLRRIFTLTDCFVGNVAARWTWINLEDKLKLATRTPTPKAVAEFKKLVASAVKIVNCRIANNKKYLDFVDSDCEDPSQEMSAEEQESLRNYCEELQQTCAQFERGDFSFLATRAQCTSTSVMTVTPEKAATSVAAATPVDAFAVADSPVGTDTPMRAVAVVSSSGAETPADRRLCGAVSVVNTDSPPPMYNAPAASTSPSSATSPSSTTPADPPSTPAMITSPPPPSPMVDNPWTFPVVNAYQPQIT